MHASEMTTYPTKHAGAVVAVHRALGGVPHTCDIALSPKKDRVHEGLRLVEVVEKEETSSHERQDDCQVVRDEVVGERHGRLDWRRSAARQCGQGYWWGRHGEQQMVVGREVGRYTYEASELRT